MKDRVSSIMSKMSKNVTTHYNQAKTQFEKFKENPKEQFKNLIASNPTAGELYNKMTSSNITKQYEDIKARYEQVKSICKDDPEKMAEEYLTSGQSLEEQYQQIVNSTGDIPQFTDLDIPEFQDLNFPDFDGGEDFPDFSGTGLQNLMGM